MAAPTLAWGVTHIYRLPNGGHLYGREFELLPAGTMFAATTILHGVCGVEACPASTPLADWRQSSWPVRAADRPQVVADDNLPATVAEATRKLSHPPSRTIASAGLL